MLKKSIVSRSFRFGGGRKKSKLPILIFAKFCCSDSHQTCPQTSQTQWSNQFYLSPSLILSLSLSLSLSQAHTCTHLHSAFSFLPLLVMPPLSCPDVFSSTLCIESHQQPFTPLSFVTLFVSLSFLTFYLFLSLYVFALCLLLSLLIISYLGRLSKLPILYFSLRLSPLLHLSLSVSHYLSVSVSLSLVATR